MKEMNLTKSIFKGNYFVHIYKERKVMETRLVVNRKKTPQWKNNNNPHPYSSSHAHPIFCRRQHHTWRQKTNVRWFHPIWNTPRDLRRTVTASVPAHHPPSWRRTTEMKSNGWSAIHWKSKPRTRLWPPVGNYLTSVQCFECLEMSK